MILKSQLTIVGSTAVYMMSKKPGFSVIINPIYLHVASQPNCRPTFFVTELT